MNSNNSCVYYLGFPTNDHFDASFINYTSFIVCPTVLDFLAVNGGIQMTTVGILCHSQPERKSLQSSPLSVMFNINFCRYPLKNQINKLLFFNAGKVVL